MIMDKEVLRGVPRLIHEMEPRPATPPTGGRHLVATCHQKPMVITNPNLGKRLSSLIKRRPSIERRDDASIAARKDT